MENQTVPYAALEMLSAKQDRSLKRLCASFIVAICVVCVTVIVVCTCMCHSITQTSNNNTNMIMQQIEDYHNGR